MLSSIYYIKNIVLAVNETAEKNFLFSFFNYNSR
jgi:hypothetical protein